jgi:hypothetical protein
MASYVLGDNEKKDGIVDATLVFTNREYFIEIYHIPSGQTVQFKAFLTNFSDKYNSSWDDQSAYGRMDPLSAFKNTTRTISLAYDVVANSEGEAIDNMRRVSLLAAMLYPSYDNDPQGSATSINSAPLLKLSFANWIKNSNTISKSSISQASGLVGKINGGLAITPNIPAGMFDSETGVLYPKEYKISFNYTVFHTHRLGWNRESKEFFAKNFPYGVSHLSSNPPNKVKEDSKSNKTTQQKQAAVNKITNRNVVNGQSTPDFFPASLPQSRAK